MTAGVLVAALTFGGGQGSAGEELLALGGLALILLSLYRLQQLRTDPQRTRLLLGIPLALIALPLLQLIPLPVALWGLLPDRAPVLQEWTAAGVVPGALAGSLDPLATERVLWSMMVPIGVFLAAVLLRGQHRRMLTVLVFAFAGISAIIGLWQMLLGPRAGWYLYEITNPGSAVGLFANRNHLASLLSATMPVAVGYMSDLLRHSRRGASDLRVWLLTGLIIVLAVGVTATASRAGFAMFMVSVFACLWVMWQAKGPQWGGARTWLRVAGVIAGGLILQFTLYALLQRLDVDPLEDLRWELTANTLDAAAGAAGVGLGLGTFRHAYDDIGDRAASLTVYVNHAHNDYAELWLEGGVLALALVVAAYVLLFRGLRARWRSPPHVHNSDTHDRGLALGAGFALVLIGLHGFVDYPLRTLAMAAYAGLLAALLMGSVRRR